MLRLPTRNTFNFVIDALTAVALLGMTVTGLLLKYVLPPGSGGVRRHAGKVLFGWERHAWGELHFYISVAMGVLVLLHVALHWAWVCGTVRRIVLRDKAGPNARRLVRSAWGVGFLLVLTGLTYGLVRVGQMLVVEPD